MIEINGRNLVAIFVLGLSFGLGVVGAQTTIFAIKDAVAAERALKPIVIEHKCDVGVLQEARQESIQ